MCQSTPLENAIPGLVRRARQATGEHEIRQRSKTGRLRIWETRHNCHCSIVGTCLSHGDIDKLFKKCGLVVGDDATAYGIHGYVVEEVSRESQLSRVVQKFLDRRHAGMVRVVGKLHDATALAELWQREYDAGRIAGVYWALQTHAHVPEELHVRIFGDVHMLSHILGRTVHANAARASELQTRIEDLESRLARQAQHHQSALYERDMEIARLRDKQLTLHCAVAGAPNTSVSPRKSDRRIERQSRAISVARERARSAEAEGEKLTLRCRELETELAHLRRRDTQRTTDSACPGAAACRLALEDGESLRVLYLGGRTHAVSRLRTIAQAASAELYHHDGGKEEAFARIDGLISHCHAVFCPVDCISHRACLYAKSQCRRLDKLFVPLASAGGKTFERALRDIEFA